MLLAPPPSSKSGNGVAATNLQARKRIGRPRSSPTPRFVWEGEVLAGPFPPSWSKCKVGTRLGKQTTELITVVKLLFTGSKGQAPLAVAVLVFLDSVGSVRSQHYLLLKNLTETVRFVHVCMDYCTLQVCAMKSEIELGHLRGVSLPGLVASSNGKERAGFSLLWLVFSFAWILVPSKLAPTLAPGFSCFCQPCQPIVSLLHQWTQRLGTLV